MTVVAVGGDVFAGGEEPAGEPAIEKYSRLSTIQYLHQPWSTFKTMQN